MTGAGDLQWKVQVRRLTTSDDGFTSAAGIWADLGDRIPAEKTDVSDGERWRAGEVATAIMSRFRLRWSSFTAGITPKDRLVCDGREYEIVGLKEIKRRAWLEITGVARSDG